MVRWPPFRKVLNEAEDSSKQADFWWHCGTHTSSCNAIAKFRKALTEVMGVWAEYGLMFTEQAMYYPRTIFKIRTHEDILQIFLVRQATSSSSRRLCITDQSQFAFFKMPLEIRFYMAFTCHVSRCIQEHLCSGISSDKIGLKVRHDCIICKWTVSCCQN